MELPRVSKKICLLAILVFLCLIITCNLLLTVWIITSIRLNFNGTLRIISIILITWYQLPGLGGLSTVTNGTKIDGTTYVMDNLYAKQVYWLLGLWVVMCRVDLCWSNVDLMLITDQFLSLLCWTGAAGGEVSDSDQRWEQRHYGGQADRQEQHGDHCRHLHSHRHPRGGDPGCGWE